MPVQTLFDYLAEGLSLDYFLETFEGVTREQAQAVLRYGWQRIAAELKMPERNWKSGLSAMAADPQIQKELRQTNAEWQE